LESVFRQDFEGFRSGEVLALPAPEEHTDRDSRGVIRATRKIIGLRNE
jgi:hypothetical protein